VGNIGTGWTLKVLTTLFVYGTLRSEFSNKYARLLRSQAERLGPASVSGSIYRIGSYPGWKPEPAGEVRGELYKLENPEQTLSALDDYEGEDFERVEIRIGTAGHDAVWIYLYKRDPPADSRIASGDFCTP
jgi:gamma-glutamylcyclotransferase (GGCT)/AIG2-like uncharacterized protein YtfP